MNGCFLQQDLTATKISLPYSYSLTELLYYFQTGYGDLPCSLPLLLPCCKGARRKAFFQCGEDCKLISVFSLKHSGYLSACMSQKHNRKYHFYSARATILSP